MKRSNENAGPLEGGGEALVLEEERIPAEMSNWRRKVRLTAHNVINNHTVNAILTALLGVFAVYTALVSLFGLSFFAPIPLTSNNETTLGLPSSVEIQKVHIDAVRSIVSLFFMGVAALVAGHIVQIVRLPPLIGMLLIGIVFGNIPFTSQHIAVGPRWKEVVAQFALATILIRAGLALDLRFLARRPALPLTLGLGSTLFECICVFLAAHFVIGIALRPSLVFGAAAAEVSPAVVVAGALRLRGRKLGVPNIVSLMMASSVLGNIVCIVGMAVTSSLALSSSNSPNSTESNATDSTVAQTAEWWIIVSALLTSLAELLAGLILGLLLGIVLWRLPRSDGTTSPRSVSRQKSGLRAGLLAVVAFAFVLAANALRHSLSGSVAVVACASSAAIGWTVKIHEERAFAAMWAFILEPLLFVLIGRDVDLTKVTIAAALQSLAILGIAALARYLAVFAGTFVASKKGDLTMKERVFLAPALYSKATLQAALVPTFVAATQAAGIFEVESQLLFTLSVIAIVVTAPVGALWIDLLGGRLLRVKDSANVEKAVQNGFSAIVVTVPGHVRDEDESPAQNPVPPPRARHIETIRIEPFDGA